MAERKIIERLDQVLSITETNESTHKITDILTTITEDTLIKKTIQNHNNSKVCPGNEKVDHKLKDSKRAFRRAKRRYFNDKTNIDRRIEFIKAKKTYKKIIYLTEKYNKMDKLSKLAEIESKQPNLFWKTIKSLMRRDKNKPNILQ